MRRRSFLHGLAAGTILGLGTGYWTTRHIFSRHQPRESHQPNVIVLVADDMRWDVMGVAGNRIIHTPALDALATDGVLFLQHFVTTAICPTSRASIMTGQYARRHKIWDFTTPLNSHLATQTYHTLLRTAGYKVGFVGKWGLGEPLPTTAFDYWAGFAGQGDYYDASSVRTQHLDTFLAERTLEFLATVGRTQPFCMTVCTKGPHAQDGAQEEFLPDQRFAPLYQHVTIPPPATATEAHFRRLPPYLQHSEGRTRWTRRFATPAQFQHTVKQYYRLVTGVDAALGRIIDVLKRQGLYDSTIIVFTSDNGFFLGEHGLADKWWGYEEAIRTPLIVKPAAIRLGRLVNTMTLNIDIAPTILRLCGQPIPDAMQGKSLHPLLTGEGQQLRQAWFYEHLFEHPAIVKSEGVRTERYKYLQFASDSEPDELLFDLTVDPLEEHNIVHEPAYQQLRQQNQEQLATFQNILA